VAGAATRSPQAERLKIYFGAVRADSRPNQRSINVEAFDFVSVTNVEADSLGAVGWSMSRSSRCSLQPDAIVTVDRQFYATGSMITDCARRKGVRDRRSTVAGLPFTWIDSPPSANR